MRRSRLIWCSNRALGLRGSLDEARRTKTGRFRACLGVVPASSTNLLQRRGRRFGCLKALSGGNPETFGPSRAYRRDHDARYLGRTGSASAHATSTPVRAAWRCSSVKDQEIASCNLFSRKARPFRAMLDVTTGTSPTSGRLLALVRKRLFPNKQTFRRAEVGWAADYRNCRFDTHAERARCDYFRYSAITNAIVWGGLLATFPGSHFSLPSSSKFWWFDDLPWVLLVLSVAPRLILAAPYFQKIPVLKSGFIAVAIVTLRHRSAVRSSLRRRGLSGAVSLLRVGSAR